MVFPKNKSFHLGFLIIITVSFFVFYDSFLFQVWQPTNLHWVSDAPGHTDYILKSAEIGDFPAYSLWYRLVYVLSGFSQQYNRIAFTSMFLLAGLTGIKYLINYWILKTSSTNTTLLVLLSFALIFVMPILSYFTQEQYPSIIMVSQIHIYLGNISANQWHNATLILAMPLNILLFYYSVSHMESNRLPDFLIMSVLTVSSILCKPNYALAFLPVLCLAILILNIRLKHYFTAFIKSSFIAIPAILTLLYQWYYTFLHNNVFEHPTSTIWAPFLVWKMYSPHIVLSLLLSIAFPLAIFVFYFKKIDRYIIMSWLTFLVALAIFSLVAEYPSHINGNFWWGSIAANYILFLFSVKLLLNQPFNWKAKIAYGLFGLHFLSGCLLLASFFIRQSSLVL